jgi:hypothetical protein
MKDRGRQSKLAAMSLSALVGFAWVLSTTSAEAGNCLAHPPRRFELASDTVHWAIELTSGGNCIQGLRCMSMVIEDVSIAGRPPRRPSHHSRPVISVRGKAGISRHRLFCAFGKRPKSGRAWGFIYPRRHHFTLTMKFRPLAPNLTISRLLACRDWFGSGCVAGVAA